MKKIQFKKSDLISILQDLKSFTHPKIKLEQYTIDAVCAADIIFFAGVEFNDIKEKLILDLGAGTGRLSVASAFLLPRAIFSLDIDEEALAILLENINKINLPRFIHPICCDMGNIPLNLKQLDDRSQITTIMNPPFGVQTKYADRPFLKAAMNLSDVIYSIHLASQQVHEFVKTFVRKFGWGIDYMMPYNMVIEGTFSFHKRNRKQIGVNVYRLVKKKRK